MKLEAKDLRIGNLVEYFGKIRKIDGIKAMSIGGYAVEIIETDIHGRSISEYSPLESLNLNPIPLTEEWLVRFGFEKSAFNENVYSNKSIILDKRKLGWLLCDNSIDNLKHIEHVHQLQNLYFALTQEELTLNETI
jgi:hypothetical protein